MVATVASLNAAKMHYYVQSYYLGGQAEGEWLETEGSAFFNLSGKEVWAKQFKQLLLGFDPRSEGPLVQNAGKEDRQVGWDLQFAVDKSFSVIYALVPEAREAFETAVRDAVTTVIAEVVEPEFLQTRRGQGGKIREPASAPVAGFLHRTNRENEVHVHYHAILPNIGVRQDGTTGTLVSWNLYDAKLALGKAFHARFAELISERLGIECEIDDQGLSRVRGFPEQVAEALSTPSRTIAQVAEDETAKAKEEANLKIRSAKTQVPFEAVEEECRRRASTLGFSPDDARGFLGRVRQAEDIEAYSKAKELVQATLAGLPEEFSKAKLLEHAFRDGAKAHLPFAAINKAVQDLIASETELENLGRIGRKEQFRKLSAEETPSLKDQATHEEELRKLISEIIEATPELNVVEFLPVTSAVLSTLDEAIQVNEEAAAAVEKIADFAEILAQDVIATLEPLGLALAIQGHVLETLNRDVLLRRLIESRFEPTQDPVQGPASREPSAVHTTSLDTRAPEVEDYLKAQDAEKQAEGRFVAELKSVAEVPEEKARTLFRGVFNQAQDRYAEHLAGSAIKQALEGITRREAVFDRVELTRAVEQILGRRPVPFAIVDSAIDRVLDDPKRVVSLGEVRGTRRYTTAEMLHVEELGLKAAEALEGRRGHAERRGELHGILRDVLTPEQRAVAKALSGPDLVLIEAGDGLQMQAVQRGLNQALKKGPIGRGIENMLRMKDLLWVAPTATAERELQRTVGAKNVATVQKLLFNLDRGLGETVKHHATMLVHAAVGLPTWKQNQLCLTAASTVILDSASLVDTRQLSRLLQHVERAGARLIVCGTHEMPSLGPGGFFKELRQRASEASLVTLRGTADSRIEAVPKGTREQAKKSLIELWEKEALKRPQDHTIVAASGRDVRELNEMAQARRKEAGRLGVRSMTVRYKIGRELIKERIYEGDRVVFTARTDKEVINGVFGTVKHIDLLTGRMKVALDLKEKTYLPWEFDRQKTITFQYRKYLFFRRREEGFRLGYAATIYRTQNVAVEGNAYCLLGGPMGAPSAVYAGLGLAKGKTYFFGDHREERAELLQEKQTAHEVKRSAEEELRQLELLRQGVEQLKGSAMEQGPRQGQGMGMGF
jgi:conjugative relaxase-like TrwC/TraI family protein